MATQATIERILAHGVSNRIVRWALSYCLNGYGDHVALNVIDANGASHDKLGLYESKGGGDGASGSRLSDIASLSRVSERDAQARKLGYLSFDDMSEKANQVPDERINKILQGASDMCKAHEGLAVLNRNPMIMDAFGNVASFTMLARTHYKDGDRRYGNKIKLDNFRTLPMAIKAIKQDKHPEIRCKGTPNIKSDGSIEYPLGTQRVYKMPVSGGKMNVFVFVDRGKVSGWHITT